jgi:hypothetical protein
MITKVSSPYNTPKRAGKLLQPDNAKGLFTLGGSTASKSNAKAKPAAKVAMKKAKPVAKKRKVSKVPMPW